MIDNTEKTTKEKNAVAQGKRIAAIIGKRAMQLGKSIPAIIAAAVLSLLPLATQAQQVLKFAVTIPPGNVMVPELFNVWAKRVSEASGGELTVQVFAGPTLANAANVWERTVNGVAEIGFGIHGAVGVPFPKSIVPSLPFLSDDLPAASVALWRLYASGLIADEYKDVRVLALFTSPTTGISSKKPILSLADMKGVKIRAADRNGADMVTALGASPIPVPAPEIYQALSSGVVGGAVAGWVTVGTFKLFEQVTEHLEMPLGTPPGFVVMNRQAYDKLTPKAKEALDRNSGESFSREFGTWFQGTAEKSRNMVKALPNHHVRSLSPQEQERWRQAVTPVIKRWADSTPDGEKVLAAYRAELQKPGK